MRSKQRANTINTYEHFDLPKLLTVIVASQSVSADAKDIQLGIEIVPDSLTMFAHHQHVRQIIDNLVTNAIRYTDAGGEVSISMTHDAHYVTIGVRDTGKGIDSSFHKSIFEPFARATESQTGTGLGLAITKEFVDMYNGQIWLESIPDVGSQFFVRLPITFSAVS